MNEFWEIRSKVSASTLTPHPKPLSTWNTLGSWTTARHPFTTFQHPRGGRTRLAHGIVLHRQV